MFPAAIGGEIATASNDLRVVAIKTALFTIG
jgi:hypothetical protein